MFERYHHFYDNIYDSIVKKTYISLEIQGLEFGDEF